MSGYVRIHRRLCGHPAFRNDAEAMAFAWLIAKAQWRATRVRYKERGIALLRGQLAISVRDFANAMDRDKAWIERLLKRLRAETMIETSHETGVNIITICNYEDYQSEKKLSETPAKTQDEMPARQAQDTEQGMEELKLVSVDKSTGVEPPDPLKELFDVGVSILTASGQTEKQARSLVGKWRKAKTDAEVLAAFLDCRARAISNPIEWLTKRFNGAGWVSKSGYEYRGDDESVMRQAEKRSDWDTYWAIKGAKSPAMAQAGATQ